MDISVADLYRVIGEKEVEIHTLRRMLEELSLKLDALENPEDPPTDPKS